LGLAKVTIVKTFGKIRRYTLCSGVAAYAVSVLGVGTGVMPLRQQ